MGAQNTALGADQPPRRLSNTLGALSGALATLGFIVIHDIWILDIWDMTGQMVFAGALSGLLIVWSYNAAVTEHSPSRWLGYNGLITLLLVLLGIASFVVLEPRFTMGEAMTMGDDAIGQLLPPAIPLMIGAALVGTAVLWAAFGRRRGALLPILLAQALVVFFVGHQLAILGVVEATGELIVFYGEFVIIALYLAAAYAGGVMLLTRVHRAHSPGRAPTPAVRP